MVLCRRMYYVYEVHSFGIHMSYTELHDGHVLVAGRLKSMPEIIINLLLIMPGVDIVILE